MTHLEGFANTVIRWTPTKALPALHDLAVIGMLSALAANRPNTRALEACASILLRLSEKRAPKVKVHIPSSLEILMWQQLGFNPLH